jgi:hypothetical protein
LDGVQQQWHLPILTLPTNAQFYYYVLIYNQQIKKENTNSDNL